MRLLTRLVIIIALVTWFGCSKKSTPLTGPSETTNGTEIAIAGTNLTIRGEAKQSLLIYSEAYNPIYGSGFSDSLELIPNLNMDYTFPDTGVYNLFLFNTTGDSGIAITSVKIKPGLKDSLSLKMSALGSVSGSSGKAGSGSAVYIQGSSYGSWFSANGKFHLDGIPSGNFTLRAEQIIRRYTDSLKSLDTTLSISIQSKDTLTINLN
jgi:hypothetical protein